MKITKPLPQNCIMHHTMNFGISVVGEITVKEFIEKTDVDTISIIEGNVLNTNRKLKKKHSLNLRDDILDKLTFIPLNTCLFDEPIVLNSDLTPPASIKPATLMAKALESRLNRIDCNHRYFSCTAIQKKLTEECHIAELDKFLNLRVKVEIYFDLSIPQQQLKHLRHNFFKNLTGKDQALMFMGQIQRDAEELITARQRPEALIASLVLSLTTSDVFRGRVRLLEDESGPTFIGFVNEVKEQMPNIKNKEARNNQQVLLRLYINSFTALTEEWAILEKTNEKWSRMSHMNVLVFAFHLIVKGLNTILDEDDAEPEVKITQMRKYFKNTLPQVLAHVITQAGGDPFFNPKNGGVSDIFDQGSGKSKLRALIDGMTMKEWRERQRQQVGIN